MKNTSLLLTIMVAMCVQAIAQNDILSTFVQENNQWNIVEYPTFSPNTITYSIRLEGDTLIDEMLYKKVCYGNPQMNTWSCGAEFIREDTLHKRVYHKVGSQTENLLYDFSLMIGDTFYSEFCTLLVTNVDTVFLNNGELRKRLELANVLHPYWNVPTYWIEGIGSDLGTLNHFYYCGTDYAQRLLCFYSDGILLYPSNPPNCFVVGVEEAITNVDIHIYPNPTDKHLTVQVADANTPIQQIRLYDLHGKAMALDARITSIGNSIHIDVSQLPKGIYLLYAQVGEQQVVRKVGVL